MATLILTAVGSAIGGPIGGAIGAILGQQVDQAIFKPAARQGPRLTDLAVQSSSYGAQIPRLFGRARVAGTVIWSTDLIETKKRQSNGKGRASTDTYSYSVSFAVLLSARAITDVGRIWADGKLLRGAAGDLKVETVLRIHHGDADAAPDPLIASAEGVDAPAYRGAAYAVFEGLQLGDFGNRIPSLSFEVVADPEPVSGGAILAELGDLAADAGGRIAGLAATGGSVRAFAETISGAFPLLCRDEAQGVRLRFEPVSAGSLNDDDLGARAGDERAPRLAVDVDPLDVTASAISIAYFDGARDYQPGLQRARREGPGRREERIDLPATLDAGQARMLAEAALAMRIAARTRATVLLPWRAMTLRPGDAVTVSDTLWRIAEMRFERMVVRLDLVRIGAVAMRAAAVEPGRIVAQSDTAHGATSLIVVDLPQLSEVAATRPMLGVFAAGISPGWRRAALLASADGGATFESIASTALPATFGMTATALAPASPDLIDRTTAVEVTLLNTGMTLFDADTAQLLAGANRAMIGDEMVQFGRALPIAPGQYRLSELWRGRRGTEAAIALHPAESRFVLIDPDTATLLPAASSIAGVRVMAAGIGDSAPYPQASCDTAAATIAPLSPVHLSATLLPSGDTEIRWVRRSREGWLWRDGVDVPVAEERELYRVTRHPESAAFVEEVGEPFYLYRAAQRSADLADGATSVAFAIAQVGAGAVSDATFITLALI